MTVEHTLKRKRKAWGGDLLIAAREALSEREFEVVAPRATAAMYLLTQANSVTPDAATRALEEAATAREPLTKPFLSLDADGDTIDFVDAFVELVRRGFFSSSSAAAAAERLERSVLNHDGDMRWRLRCRLETWAVRALWIGFGWFRRDGDAPPEEATAVMIRELGLGAQDEQLEAIALPDSAGLDMDELLECEEGTLRLVLSREPDDAALTEIYRVLELWARVVAPGFPRYGTFMGMFEPAALDTRTEVILGLPLFGRCDPRALQTVGHWIEREGARLGITGYQFEP